MGKEVRRERRGVEVAMGEEEATKLEGSLARSATELGGEATVGERDGFECYECGRAS